MADGSQLVIYQGFNLIKPDNRIQQLNMRKQIFPSAAFQLIKSDEGKIGK